MGIYEGKNTIQPDVNASEMPHLYHPRIPSAAGAAPAFRKGGGNDSITTLNHTYSKAAFFPSLQPVFNFITW